MLFGWCCFASLPALRFPEPSYCNNYRCPVWTPRNSHTSLPYCSLPVFACKTRRFCLILVSHFSINSPRTSRSSARAVDNLKLNSILLHLATRFPAHLHQATPSPPLARLKPFPGFRMELLSTGDLPAELRYIQYEHTLEEQYLPAIRSLISKDLSEPYSIYVYRYFLYQWAHLCFMVCTHGSHVRNYR